MPEENVLIDTLSFSPALEVVYENVIGMFSDNHYQDCCESHYLDWESTPKDWEMVESTLNSIDKIEIKGAHGDGVTFFFYEGEKRVGIFVPGRGYNNGYYGTNLSLDVTLPNGFSNSYDISDFQDIDG